VAKRKPAKPKKPAPKRKRPPKPKPPRKRAAAPPDPDALTLAEQTFLEHFLLTDNRTLAYRKAHPGCSYHTARSEGCKLLAKPSIRREVDAFRAEQRRRFRVRAAAVLRERAWLAHSDLGDVVDLSDPDWPRLKPYAEIPLAARRAVKSVAVSAHGGVKVVMHDKPASVTSLEKHLGLTSTEIPSLDALLALLPAPLAALVRAALAGTPTDVGEGSPGG
jgi:hypothetical protein